MRIGRRVVDDCNVDNACFHQAVCRLLDVDSVSVPSTGIQHDSVKKGQYTPGRPVFCVMLEIQSAFHHMIRMQQGKFTPGRPVFCVMLEIQSMFHHMIRMQQGQCTPGLPVFCEMLDHCEGYTGIGDDIPPKGDLQCAY